MPKQLMKQLLREYRQTELCESMTFWRFAKLFKHITGRKVIHKFEVSEAQDLENHGGFINVIIDKVKAV